MMRNRHEWRNWRGAYDPAWPWTTAERDRILAPEHAPERIWEAEDSFRDVCRICGQRWPCRSASTATTPEETP